MSRGAAIRLVAVPSDLELLDAWQAGNHASGEELFDRHFDPVMRFFRNKLSEGCEDLVQQTFLACLESRDRFRRESSFRTFLFAVAHNVLRNHLRAKRRRGLEIDFSRDSVWGIAPSPSTIFTRHRSQERLLNALRRIPIEHQVALELHYWEDLTGAEVGAVLGIPTGTAKTRLRRAKALLAEQLDEVGRGRARRRRAPAQGGRPRWLTPSPKARIPPSIARPPRPLVRLGSNAIASRLSCAAPCSGADRTPVRIGRFDVLRRLGAGGMGVVYSAFDDELDRKVAIKLVLADRTGGTQRLRREAQAIAKLSHPNVAVVYEVGEHRGQVFIAMEFVRGVTLRQWLDAETRSWPEIRDVFIQAGEGLAAAHAADLVHRDFKPDNVMVGDDGRVRVLDFGLAAVTGEAPPAGASAESSPVSTRLTATGALVGTPAYMAPEQLAGGRSAPRSDQFSFCVCLWEALMQRRPFDGDTVEGLAAAVCDGPRPAIPDTPGLPATVGQAIVRGLSVDPDDRFDNMRQLLAAVSVDPAARRRRASLALGGAGLVVVASAAGYFIAAADQSCAPAQTQLEPFWTAGRRSAAETALARAETPVPLPAWAKTATALDEFVDEWTAVYERTCAAANVGEELRLERQLCLQWELEALQPLTDALVAGEAEAVARTASELQTFPRPAQCETEAQLKRLAQSRALGTSPRPSRRGLVSDFEDGIAVEGGAGWAPSTDSIMGGASTAAYELVSPGAGGRGQALRMTGEVGGEGPVAWGGAMMFPGTAPFGPTNLSEETTLVFNVRGDPGRGALMLFTVRAGFDPARHSFDVTPEWTQVRIELDDLDAKRFDVTGIFFGAVEPGAFDIYLDDVGFE